MSVKDLISAIASGNAAETQELFNQTMMEKISDRLDDMRIEVAQGMFATEEVDLDEEQLDELSKNTMKSYVSKSMDSAIDHVDKTHSAHDKIDDEGARKSINKTANRLTGIKRAGSKLGDKSISKNADKAVASRHDSNNAYSNLDDKASQRHLDKSDKYAGKVQDKTN